MPPRRQGARRRASATRASSDVRAVLDAFRRIVQALRLAAREGESRAGLTSAQSFALQQIAEHPGASINDVAALTFTHQSSVSVVIRRLVARRLVVRLSAADDRRRQRLLVTADGVRALRRAPVAMQERLIAAIVALPADGRQALAQSLGSVARRVAPSSVARRAPMLFEEGAGTSPGRATPTTRRTPRPRDPAPRARQ